MIRKCQLLFCENEHGTGDVCYPDINSMTADQIQQVFIDGLTGGSLRKAAKQAGWGRLNGGDYCPGCMESM